MNTSPNVPPTARNSAESAPAPALRRFRRPLAMAAATVLGVIGFAASRATGPVSAQTSTSATSTPARSIIVNGTGRVSVTPDRLFLNLGVETRAPKVADALRANNKAAQDLIKVLKDKGVADKDIKTSQLSIYPQFDTTGRKITSYQVTNSVTATIRDISTSGDLIDAAATVAGDAIRINGLDFTVGDPSVALASARDLAVKDAKTQAEQLAASAGVKLGKLRTISSGDTTQPPVFRQSVAVADASAATPISAGSQDVTTNVQLIFDIAD
jgi:uncharacterized protein